MKRLASCLLLGILLMTSTALAQEGTPTPTTYTVVSGDTLGNIAFRYGITTQALMNANGLTNPNLIITGTVLVIPQAGETVPAATLDVPASGEAYVPAALVPIPSIGFDVGGEILSFSNLDVVQAAGMTWTKFSLVWHVGDSALNARRIINRLHELGFKVLLEISAAAPENPDANLGLYYANFTAYLSEVAAFGPDAIEVWGGANVAREGWASGLSDAMAYADLLRSAFTAIKRGNSSVLVISGAPEPTTADGAACTNRECDVLPYMQALAATDAGQFADCIGIGYTLGMLPPDATSGDARGSQIVYYYPTLIAAYAQFFPNKPLCVTQIGYLAGGNLPLDTPFDWSRETTPELQGVWLAQAADFARQIGRVRLFMVYNVDGRVSTLENPEASYAIIGADGTCAACEALGLN